MRGLYLKLDKKFTLEIDYLKIPKNKKETNFQNPSKQITKLQKVLSYFDYIELKDVIFTNNHYSLVYADSIIYIKNNQYEVAGTISHRDDKLVVNTPLIYISEYGLRLDGEVTYSYSSGAIDYNGAYSIAGIDGNLTLGIRGNKIEFKLDSSETNGISRLLDILKVSDDTREWIDKRVVAHSYNLESLKGHMNHSPDGWKLDNDSLYGVANLNGVSIEFEDTLKPIIATSAKLVFDSKGLDINLTSPKYGKKVMQGSRVAISNIIGDSYSTVSLDLYFHCQIDSEIKEILKAYDISIPLSQRKGVSKAYIALEIPIINKPTKVEGRIFLSKGEIDIGGAKLLTNGGEVTFDNRLVSLWGVEFHDSWYSAVVNGTINLRTKKAKYKLNLKRLQLGKGTSTKLVMKNIKNLPLTMDYNNRLTFKLPSLKIAIKTNKKSGITISANSINALRPYIKNLPIKIKGGKIDIVTYNYKRYNFKGNTHWKDSYLYTKKGYIKKIQFNGYMNSKKTHIKALKGRFVYDSAKSTIKINRLNIDAKKMTKNSSKRSSKSKTKLNIYAKKSIIRYDKHVLLTDRFSLKIGRKVTKFDATKDGDSIHLKLKGKHLTITAKRIKERMLSALINFGGMRGGRYSLKLSGRTDGLMKGHIDIDGGAISKFKAYNDLIALFNTIPALMAFSDPGFSDKGYIIRKGKIDFSLYPHKLILNKILIDGKSATLAGKGTVNLDTQRLNIDLAIHTARELGSFIGSLPLVGYILFGKDKSITTGVKILGTMDKPIVKNETVKDILLSPLKLIKRTVESPAHIIND